MLASDGSQQANLETPGCGTATGKGTALRLRGLPFSATEDDIRRFFASYSLNDVYMCRRNGMCLYGFLYERHLVGTTALPSCSQGYVTQGHILPI